MRITVLCGISNSGKSTWAHSQWLQNPLNTVIVNRDKIREALFGFTEDTVEYYYHRKDFLELENIVADFENNMVKSALDSYKHVIVDATHLKYSYVEKWRSMPHEVIVKYFDITLEEALERNSKRRRKVLENVIKDQFERYKKLKENV